ncbi:MAG: hypothetical protein WD071_01035 [Pseudohongiella sp.]|uniref:LpxL/LpxP family acyltransferase n=1 Tax=Pseudohongiella sp. TaxID=1979412 RepID=UPI0034A0159C
MLSMIRTSNDSIDTRLQAVREACNHGDIATGVRMLCAAFERVLASRSVSMSWQTLTANPIPVHWLGFVRTESGLKLRLLSDDFSSEECRLMIDYVAGFNAGLPRLTIAERMEVWARRCTERSMRIDADLSTKRRQIWLLTIVRFWLSSRQASADSQFSGQLIVLGYLLHEPQTQVRTICRQQLFWFHFNFARRLLHLDNRPESECYLQKFDWPDRNDYCRLIANNTDSRVLASIHMGDFFGAFRVLSASSDPGRCAISLRRDMTDNHGMQNFSADRISHRVIYHEQQQPATIVSALRRGQHTLAILFDLREDFGSTVTVNFFGHRARFVKGPAQLAILGRSNIIPFVTFESRGRNRILMAPVIETRMQPGESLQHATVRITQKLAELAENWIRQWPEQWKYLPLLPAYLEAER